MYVVDIFIFRLGYIVILLLFFISFFFVWLSWFSGSSGWREERRKGVGREGCVCRIVGSEGGRV